MKYAFTEARSFSGTGIGGLNTAKVTDFTGVFDGAENFDANLDGFCRRNARKRGGYIRRRS